LSDVKTVCTSIITSPQQPELPDSKWDNVLWGHALALHKIFASLYAVGNAPEHLEGRLEIRVPATTTTKKVITQCDWAMAWQMASTAILFTFPHHGGGLTAYQTYINKQFHTVRPRRHDWVIAYDQVVCMRIGQCNDL
jgi:hypothetical protein